MNQRLLERISAHPDLPSLPVVAIRVMELAQLPDVPPQKVAEAISQDPALAVKVLRTVNSSLYGCSQSIGSVHAAVVMLGMESVKTLVLGFSIASAMAKHEVKGFDRITYWRRSLYAATAARVLASKLGLIDKEACFLTGLLMDVGTLAMDTVLGEAYATCVARARNHAELMAAEDRAFDLNHQQVTAFLAARWKLPDVLADPMGNHHTPENVIDSHLQPYAAVAGLAARCADVFVDKQPMWSIADVRRICLEKFGINQIDCDSAMCEIGLRTRELAPLFEVKVDAEAMFDKILTRANEQLLDMTRVAQDDQDEDSDRRRAPRIRRDKQVTILPCSEGVIRGSIPVKLTDVSARGVGFVHTAPIEVGAQFIFRVPKSDTVPITLLYTVARCFKLPNEQFRIGAQLECVLKEDNVSTGTAGAPSGARAA